MNFNKCVFWFFVFLVSLPILWFCGLVLYSSYRDNILESKLHPFLEINEKYCLSHGFDYKIYPQDSMDKDYYNRQVYCITH